MDPAEDPQQVAGSVTAGTTLRSPTYGEMVSATEHDAADVILQRAEEFDVDLAHPRTPTPPRIRTVEEVIHRHPPYSVLLARPPQNA